MTLFQWVLWSWHFETMQWPYLQLVGHFNPCRWGHYTVSKCPDPFTQWCRVISKKNETLTIHTEIYIFIPMPMSYNMWYTWSANFNMCRQLCSFHDGSKRDLISPLKHSFCTTKSTYWKEQLFWTQHSSCCCHCFTSALGLQVRQEVL